MKILHVITNLQRAAGTSVFCGEVANALAEMGHDVTIAIVDPESKDKIPLDERVRLVSIASLLGSKSCGFDIVHIHALWSPALHLASKWARRLGIPVVWSTHGMTAPWAMHHKRWKKLVAWRLYQQRDLLKATAIHCTTEQEVAWNRSLGFGKFIVAPLGTSEVPSRDGARTDRHDRVMLFVGRIHPVKGLANLINAWGLVAKHRPLIADGWKLRIVGPNQDGHQVELEKLVKELGLCDSVEFAGPKFGDELSSEYGNCDCLALPSFTENFGATVVDALAHGKPCIASVFTPWKELVDFNCGWWVSNEPQPLANALSEAMSLDDASLCAMGEHGQHLVNEKYTWRAVAETMLAGYASVSA